MALKDSLKLPDIFKKKSDAENKNAPVEMQVPEYESEEANLIKQMFSSKIDEIKKQEEEQRLAELEELKKNDKSVNAILKKLQTKYSKKTLQMAGIIAVVIIIIIVAVFTIGFGGKSEPAETPYTEGTPFATYTPTVAPTPVVIDPTETTKTEIDYKLLGLKELNLSSTDPVGHLSIPSGSSYNLPNQMVMHTMTTSDIEQLWTSVYTEEIAETNWGIKNYNIVINPTYAYIYNNGEHYTTIEVNSPWRLHMKVDPKDMGVEDTSRYANLEMILYQYDEDGNVIDTIVIGWNTDYTHELEQISDTFNPGYYSLGIFLRNAGVSLDIQRFDGEPMQYDNFTVREGES